MRPFLATCATLLTMTGLLAISANKTVSTGQTSGSGGIPERFLGLFHSGEQIMEIKPSGKEGEVRVSIRGGPSTTELLGHVSAEDKLLATGQHRFCTLLGGCDVFMCNLTGEVNGIRLTGTYGCIPVGKSGSVGAQLEHRQYREGPGKLSFEKFEPVHAPP